ncbi:glycosyltransferase family 4 protein [Roseiflexus sp.]|uniref:glycosyltransferase family 4 protein n=1 Tax=Roseiflexus sp. TaxID=2562120 RepID=UPI0021DCDD40|nr:glycosyltransferase family 4 protein [Roseiflexus sp.]GIV99283.1 MAG: glycosyl transferase family 1 [Roseiflexus sp.]
MRLLVVATNTTPPSLSAEVRAGRHQRVDYLDLAQRFGTVHHDYNALRPNWLARRFEDLFRFDVRQAMAVARLAKRGGYDVVVSLSERVGIPLALMLDRRIRHVVIFHHGMSPQKLRLIRALKLQRRWDVIAAISRAEAEGMRVALGLDDQRVVALHTPVDVAFYKPSRPSTGGEAFIQSLGLSHRDYPTLIRAMRRLPHIPCHLRVGSTWVTRRGGHESERLPPNVSLQPFVHPSILRQCYEESRFIIVPIRASTQWSAGCTSVQAAQAMGKPVVATRRPGLSEYLIDGETGVLVEPGDDQGMAETIETLWNDPQRVVRMGRRAREWVASNHSLDQWLDRVEALVQRAICSTARHWTNGSFLASVCAICLSPAWGTCLRAMGETLSALTSVIAA